MAEISIDELKRRGRVLTTSLVGILAGVCITFTSAVIAEKNTLENPYSPYVKDNERKLHDLWNREHFTLYSDSGKAGMYGGAGVSGISLLYGIASRRSWQKKNKKSD